MGVFPLICKRFLFALLRKGNVFPTLCFVRPHMNAYLVRVN
uniref:Uncharacterized protein n=1 Tax=Rhizophora mucronata TaxID=61149 RepID=A0A2P2N8Q8_RHIMU